MGSLGGGEWFRGGWHLLVFRRPEVFASELGGFGHRGKLIIKSKEFAYKTKEGALIGDYEPKAAP